MAGLAPFDDDSGTHKGQRHIAGGRGQLRRSLFAAALPAVAAAKTPEAYEKVGNTITKQGIRRNVFGGAAGEITMRVPTGKTVCVVKPNGTVKAAKIEPPTQ